MIVIRYSSLNEILRYIRGNDHHSHFRSCLLDEKSETKNGMKIRSTYLAVQALSGQNGENILHSYIELVGEQRIGNNFEIINFDDWKGRTVSKLTAFEDQMEDISNWTEAFIDTGTYTVGFLSWEEMGVTGEVLKDQLDSSLLKIDDREISPEKPATGEIEAFQPDGVIKAGLGKGLKDPKNQPK